MHGLIQRIGFIETREIITRSVDQRQLRHLGFVAQRRQFSPRTDDQFGLCIGDDPGRFPRMQLGIDRHNRRPRDPCAIHDHQIFNAVRHEQGDVVLKAVAAQMQAMARKVDLVSRFGGEEFVVVLQEAPLSAAVEMAQRLRQAVAELSFEPMPQGVTCSYGVAQFATGQTVEQLLKHADEHHQLAQILLEKEIIYAENLEHIFGKRPWISRSQEILQSEDNSKNVNDDLSLPPVPPTA